MVWSALASNQMLHKAVRVLATERLAVIAILFVTIAACGCGGKRAKLKAARIGATESGIASWYGHPYHGRRAANGEIYDMEQLTAAHRTLPFGTWVRVKNLSNEKTVEVRVQDRGPFIDGRIIDLSRAAAREIDMIGPGITKVKLTIIERPLSAGQRRPPSPVPAASVKVEAPRVESEPAAPIAAESFGVQVGAFAERERAEEVAAAMRERLGVARITIKEGTTRLYRVLAGAYPYIEDAEAALARIQQDGGSGFVVRLDP